jgi:hypothetical protein
MQYSNYVRGGWSQFVWNACLIIAHHMQCNILLIQRVVWVSIAAHGKQESVTTCLSGNIGEVKDLFLRYIAIDIQGEERELQGNS